MVCADRLSVARASCRQAGRWRCARKEQIMYEPPVDLPEAALEAGLRVHYGLDVAAITMLSLGQDTAAWVYRVLTATNAAYFLTVRRRVSNAPSLLVPRYLHDQGVAQ